MVRKSIIILLCCISGAVLQAFEVGDKIVSSKTFTKRNGEVTIYEGQVYEVLRINSVGNPIIDTSPNVALGSTEQTFFETIQDYSKFQNLTESIAFGSGALLFLVFAKGFNASFPI